jgi:hypothetical protein
MIPRRKSIAEIERHLRALRLPDEIIERHVNRLRTLRRIPRLRLVRVLGRGGRRRWKAVQA